MQPRAIKGDPKLPSSNNPFPAKTIYITNGFASSNQLLKIWF